jgi:hypothetical protein
MMLDSKPYMRLVRGEWECSSPGKTGIASTPELAYEAWVNCWEKRHLAALAADLNGLVRRAQRAALYAQERWAFYQERCHLQNAETGCMIAPPERGVQ